jgi:hypothetical protein
MCVRCNETQVARPWRLAAPQRHSEDMQFDDNSETKRRAGWAKETRAKRASSFAHPAPFAVPSVFEAVRRSGSDWLPDRIARASGKFLF